MNFKNRIAPYLPGILLFFITFIISILTYQDYGISWDEKEMRQIGEVTYNFVTTGNKELFGTPSMHYGAGYELPLLYIEKCLSLTDTREIYLMRHLVTNIFFLFSAFFLYVLAYRIYNNKFIACLAFIMLAFSPRLYAHSFFNSKDLPFLSMFPIIFCCCHAAFNKSSKGMFLVLGMLCGYTTTIRIMGIMPTTFIVLFLLIDLFTGFKSRGNRINTLLKILLFLFGFCFTLYISWPFLWPSPVHNFIDSFNSFSRFPFTGAVLLNGKFIEPIDLPWTYFPIWFLITNPEIWLVAGFSGAIMLTVSFFKRPANFLKNNVNRNQLLFLMSFFAPIIAVLVLHSVIYDDWRHLYFIYPSFVMIGLYCIYKMLLTKYKRVIQLVCAIQIGFIGFFMVKNHPFGQVYFNNFISHKPEYLRENYDMDYWGVGFKQGLDYLMETDKSPVIKVGSPLSILIKNNIMLIPKDQRGRIQNVGTDNGDYLISNYRLHPEDYQYKNVYAFKVLNSTILAILKIDKDSVKRQQFKDDEIKSETSFDSLLKVAKKNTNVK